MFNNLLNFASIGLVQQGTNPSIPPDPPVTPEFDTVDFNDNDFKTDETP